MGSDTIHSAAKQDWSRLMHTSVGKECVGRGRQEKKTSLTKYTLGKYASARRQRWGLTFAPGASSLGGELLGASVTGIIM